MRALFVTVWLAGGAAFAQADPDPWLAPDKALHFAVSAGIAGVGYSGVRVMPVTACLLAT